MNQSNQPPRPVFRSLYTTDAPLIEARGDLARRLDWAAPLLSASEGPWQLIIGADQQPEAASGGDYILDDNLGVYNRVALLDRGEGFHSFTPQRLGRLLANIRAFVSQFHPAFFSTGLLDFAEMLFPQWQRMPAGDRDRLRSEWIKVWSPGSGWFSDGTSRGTAEFDYDAFAALVMRRILEAADDACPVSGGWSYPTVFPMRLLESGADGEAEPGIIGYPLDGVGLGCERNTAMARSILRSAGRVVVQLYFPAMIDESAAPLPLWKSWGQGLMPRADMREWVMGNLVEAMRVADLAGLPLDVMTHPMYQRWDKPFHETMISAGELGVLLSCVRLAPLLAARQPWAAGRTIAAVRSIELWGSIGTVDRVGLSVEAQMARVTDWAKSILWPTVNRVWPVGKKAGGAA